MAKPKRVRSAGKNIAGFTTVQYVLALEKVADLTRNLVALEPVDTGYVGRALAVKEALLELDKVIEPHA